MDIFHLYLRPAGSQTSFETTTDSRWAWVDQITLDLNQGTGADRLGRPLKSLIRHLHDRCSERLQTIPDQSQIAVAIGDALFSNTIGASERIQDLFDNYYRDCLAE